MIRPPRPGEEALAQAVWEVSQAEDDPGGRQRGGWSLGAWASDWQVLVDGADRPIGVAAIRRRGDGPRVEPEPRARATEAPPAPAAPGEPAPAPPAEQEPRATAPDAASGAPGAPAPAELEARATPPDPPPAPGAPALGSRSEAESRATAPDAASAALGAPTAEVVQARLALAPSAREARAADELVEASIDLAGPARLLRQWIPSRANWARHAAERAGFERVRTVYHMLRPADAPPLEARPPDGVRIRPIRPGEEARVLAALNRNWSTTWGFVPIRLDQLREDLEGQAEGMLLGVDAADEDRILATCHAIFDPTDQNPDGHPRAWISNLTVDPDHRGRGLGRLLLAAALAHLRQRGAGSVTLGVDGGNETPLKLYRSAGFDVISSIDAWDRQLADEQHR